MREPTQAPLVAAVDLTAGAALAAARTAAHAASSPIRWSRAALDALGRVATPAVVTLAGDAPERMRASGESAR